MAIYRVFAANLRERCLARGTIADFCKQAEINRQQFNRYLAGSAIPNPKTMARICAALNIREEQLFAEHPAPPAARAGAPVETAQPEPTKDKPTPSGHGTILFKADNAEFAISATHRLGISEGYYYCYFPAQNIDNHLVRSLIRIRVSGTTTYFKRLTLLRTVDAHRKLLVVSKHEGCVISDEKVSYFLGRDNSSDSSLSMLVIENKAKAFNKILRGIGMVEGSSAHLACQLCLEPILQEQSNRRRMIGRLGMVSLQDATLNPVVKQLLSSADESHQAYITMPALEKPTTG